MSTTENTATATSTENGSDAAVSQGSPVVTEESILSPMSSEEQDDGPDDPNVDRGTALRVLFLSSDTGGGHRASAQSLAKQFEILFPGSTYKLLDLATETYLPPYNSIVSYYKHLSAHPSQWKLLYGVTNSKFMERAVETNMKVMTVICERNIRKKIKSYRPDVVVSVHPLQTSVPILSCAKISHETGRHLPMFTVVTDLGSAHCTWFANGVEKMFVGSTQILQLAKDRGNVPDEKLVLLGLPIRHDFAIEAEHMGDRFGREGKEYQQQVRSKLDLPAVDRRTLLLMGGGEGVGSLSNLVDALYCELVRQGINAVIMVVCGRNEKLKGDLEEKDWDKVFQKGNEARQAKGKQRKGLFPALPRFGDLGGCADGAVAPVGCIEEGVVSRSLRKILSSGSLMNSENPVFIPSPTKPAIEDEKKEMAAADQTPASTEETEPKTPSRKTLGAKSMSIGPIPMHESLSEAEDEQDKGEASVSSAEQQNLQPASSLVEVHQELGEVSVVGLGFVTNMAEYMVASDILVSKAGPGTISEAAAVSLPVMLTSFLPGQEEGNVDFVVDGGFGAYCHDSDPQAVAEEVAIWLNDEEKLKEMSAAAKLKGAPYAARDIVQMIGDSTHKWKEHNDRVAAEALAKQQEGSAEAPSLTDESTATKKGVPTA